MLNTTIMKKMFQIMVGLLAMTILASLSGCKMIVLDPQGLIAHQENRLLIIAVILLMIIVLPTIIISCLVAYKYRASNAKAKYTPNWAHNNLLEIAWWIAPIVICAILGTVIWKSTHKLDPYKPLVSTVKPVKVQVVSLQWRWLFIYPQQGIATINYLKVPEKTPIDISLTADSPMNAFQVPQLGGQIYTMAGMKTKLHLISDHRGIYSGRSVSFSGEGFEGMIFKTHVVSRKAFDRWVHTVKQRKNPLSLAVYKKLMAPNTDSRIKFYSSVRHNLFNTIMMQYMNPRTYKLLNSGSSVKNIEYK